MADLAALLKDEPIPQASTSSKLQGIIDADETPAPANAAPKKELHWTERFKQNFNDATIGVDQLRHNLLPDAVNRVVDKGAQAVVRTAVFGGRAPKEVMDRYEPRTSDQYNKDVEARETDYQQKKTDAGMPKAELGSPSTWDVAGITGALANPINWAGPKSEAASALGRVATASRNGALVSLWQPVSEAGDYWSNKFSQVKMGAIAGGAFAGAAEALSPALKYATSAIRAKFGKGVDVNGAASQVVDDAIQKTGIKPEEVPAEFKTALTDEVARGVKKGEAPDMDAAVRQTRAASVGMKLTEGAAKQDPNLYAAEQKLRGVAKGNEITMLDRANQTAAVTRLSEWGAGGIEGMPRAPDTYRTAQGLIELAKQKDDALTSQINQAYAAVRNSQGQSAKVDHIAFSDNAMTALKADKPAFYDLQKSAPEVLKVIDEIGEGKIPFTVEQLTSLDKWLGKKSFSQASGDISHSINLVRQALNDAPIADSVGQEAAQAYQLAKGMARDRFQLLDKDSPHFIPAYKAAVEGEAPDKFFAKYVTRGNVRDVDKMLQFMPEAKEHVGRALMRDVQEHVVNGPMENGTFSESKLGSLLDDPANVARYEVIFGQNRTQQLLNLRAATADAFRPPRGTDVPSYKTGKSLAGLQEMAGTAADYVLPGKVRAAIGVVNDVKDKVKEGGAARKATEKLSVTTPPKKAPPKLLPKIESAAAVPLSILASQPKRTEDGE